MSKKDVRIYLDADYCDYLKQVADEQDSSLNQLIVSLVRKKYPMPRKPKEEQPTIDRAEVQKRLDEITRILDNAMKSEQAKVSPKSAFMFMINEQKRLRALLDD